MNNQVIEKLDEAKIDAIVINLLGSKGIQKLNLNSKELKDFFRKMDFLAYLEHLKVAIEKSLRAIIRKKEDSNYINSNDINLVIQYLTYSKNTEIKLDTKQIILKSAFEFNNFSQSELAILNEIANLKKEPIKELK